MPLIMWLPCFWSAAHSTKYILFFLLSVSVPLHGFPFVWWFSAVWEYLLTSTESRLQHKSHLPKTHVLWKKKLSCVWLAHWKRAKRIRCINMLAINRFYTVLYSHPSPYWIYCFPSFDAVTHMFWILKKATRDYLKQEVRSQIPQPPTVPPTARCCCSLAISEPSAILQCFNPCIIIIYWLTWTCNQRCTQYVQHLYRKAFSTMPRLKPYNCEPGDYVPQI